ncbi:MAG: tetratricopeptide repeat protein [Phycisphaerae bacterium]|nr:tetratricopeptide repeat protein [Gemmatimonadaceae bacterium]
MAQAPRSSSLAGLSDDPLENLTMWLQANSKPLLIGLAGAVVVASGIFGYRYLNNAKVQEASAALYQAQVPLLQGNLPEAQAALQRVATRYNGTRSGEQASLLLAQALYDLKQHQGAITMLEKARGSASADTRSSFDAMIAAGYEGLGNLDKAAEFYGKAAAGVTFTQEKQQHKTAQARSLMLAGKLDDARKIFLELSEDSNSQYAQEARVRLGEIAGAGVK